MKNLREELKKLRNEGLEQEGVMMVIRLEKEKEDFLLNLFRSWADEILVELYHIRANAPLTADNGKTRERLKRLIEKIEDVGK